MSQFVCDFVEIVGDSPITIGDSKTLWEDKFSTTGFTSGFPAFLMLNVKGLTYSNFDVEVVVNNLSVGEALVHSDDLGGWRDPQGRG
jgi:hypothetical protein